MGKRLQHPAKLKDAQPVRERARRPLHGRRRRAVALVQCPLSESFYILTRSHVLLSIGSARFARWKPLPRFRPRIIEPPCQKFGVRVIPEDTISRRRRHAVIRHRDLVHQLDFLQKDLIFTKKADLTGEFLDLTCGQDY